MRVYTYVKLSTILLTEFAGEWVSTHASSANAASRYTSSRTPTATRRRDSGEGCTHDIILHFIVSA